MLKLIKCEFWKLKRKRFVQLVLASAFLFPIPMTVIMLSPSQQKGCSNLAEVYDSTWNFTIGYAVMFLLPCIVGIIAAILFFMERDNDTFKNLRTIPVTSTQMVLAKISVLFVYSIIFCVSTTAVSMLFGAILFQVQGALYKFWFSVEAGFFITLGTLPIIAVIVFFSRSYIFSVLLCVFYSVISLSVSMLCDVLPKAILHMLPFTLTTFWSAGDMSKHIKLDFTPGLAAVIPTTMQVVSRLFLMATVSVMAIVVMYKKRSE